MPSALVLALSSLVGADARAEVDAGDVDGAAPHFEERQVVPLYGMPPPPSRGCVCDVSSGARSEDAGLGALAAAAIGLASRRRRRSDA